MLIRLLGSGAFIAAVSVAVLAAQHSPRPHGAPSHEAQPHQSVHQMCGSDQAATHHAEMSAALGLSADQASAIERISTEACAAMAKYHDQILAVLTPEQRAKMQQRHGVADKGHEARKHGGKQP